MLPESPVSKLPKDLQKEIISLLAAGKFIDAKKKRDYWASANNQHTSPYSDSK